MCVCVCVHGDRGGRRGVPEVILKGQKSSGALGRRCLGSHPSGSSARQDGTRHLALISCRVSQQVERNPNTTEQTGMSVNITHGEGFWDACDSANQVSLNLHNELSLRLGKAGCPWTSPDDWTKQGVHGLCLTAEQSRVSMDFA